MLNFQMYSCSRGQLKCGFTRAETGFRLSAKRTSPFKSAGASVQSTTSSRGVCISGGNAGYTTFPGSVKGYWLPTPFASFPFTSPPVRHLVPSHFNWSLLPAHWVTPTTLLLPPCILLSRRIQIRIFPSALYSHTLQIWVLPSAYEATCLGKSETNTFYYLGYLVAFGR